MKFICSQIELNSALQLVSRAVSSRPTHPVLANVLLTADEGTSRLSLTGFDLNLGIQTSIPASVNQSGAITLPARLFSEIVSKLSAETPITVFSEEDSQNVELSSLSSTYKMKGLSSDDFPDLPLIESGTSLKVSPNSLIYALKNTLFASSTDEAKQLLTGVHLIFKNDNMETAATDGHRLAISKQIDVLKSGSNLDNSSLEEDGSFAITLPSKSLREVERLISSWSNEELVSIFCDQGQVVFLGSDQILTSRTLDGIYPNYKQLVPDSFSRTIDVERRTLIAALERVAVLADQYNNVIKITTNTETQLLNINADAQDVGSGNESLSAVLKGDSLQIAFNVRYLLDGLKAIDAERVLLSCNSSTTPAILSSPEEIQKFTYLVMPVQIRS